MSSQLRASLRPSRSSLVGPELRPSHSSVIQTAHLPCEVSGILRLKHGRPLVPQRRNCHQVVLHRVYRVPASSKVVLAIHLLECNSTLRETLPLSVAGHALELKALPLLRCSATHLLLGHFRESFDPHRRHCRCMRSVLCVY